MTKAATLTLISNLSLTQTDATAIGTFYDEVVRDLGRSDVLARATFIQSVAGTAQYSMPAAAIKRLHTFYDSIHLDHEKLINLEAINSRWRDESDTPACVVVEDEDEDTFTLFPNPNVGSAAVGGADIGSGFIPYSITSMHTNFETDLPVWLELPIAFTVLGMEFNRESDHRDKDFAGLCLSVAQLMWSMLDIDLFGVSNDRT
jgi:hypothetical protein